MTGDSAPGVFPEPDVPIPVRRNAACFREECLPAFSDGVLPERQGAGASGKAETGGAKNGTTAPASDSSEAEAAEEAA